MKKIISSIITILFISLTVISLSASASTVDDVKSDTESIKSDTESIKSDTESIKGTGEDTNKLSYDIWNYINNYIMPAIQNNKNNKDVVKDGVNEYISEQNTQDDSISTNVYTIPNLLLYTANLMWDHIGETLTNGSIMGFKIDPRKYATGEAIDLIKIFAYSLVLVFFAVNLIEMTIKYEIFTIKGAVNIFGRLIISKVIIDLAAKVCIWILQSINTLALQIIDETHDNIVGNFPNINLPTSKLWVIGPIVDIIIARILIVPLILIFLSVLIVTCGVLIRLILRSFELSMLVVVSPAFFACYSSEVTKPYFKNFILTFIQVAAQIVFIAIVYNVGTDYITSQPTNINGFGDLAKWFANTLPNALIIIAMSIMMIKPPKVLTNLIK